MRGRILIVDADGDSAIACGAMLSRAFYDPVLARDEAAALSLARQNLPDVILIDLRLPGTAGRELILALRRDPRLRGIPLIAMAAEAEGEARLAAYRAGVDCVIDPPPSEAILLGWIRSLMRRREEARLVSSAWGDSAPELLATVYGLAEEEAVFVPAAAQRPPSRQGTGGVGLVTLGSAPPSGWQRALRQRSDRPVQPLTADQALQLAEGGHGPMPEIFVIDADPGGNDSGLRLMSRLSDHPSGRNSACCLVLAETDPAATVMALELGAVDVLPAGLPLEEVELRLEAMMRRKQQTDRLRATVEHGLRLAMIDPLTGCYNRRYALPRLAGIWAAAADEGTDFAVLLIDLDRFKTVNDQFGHAAGDAVLVEVARRLSQHLRAVDLLARIGGEEFLIALPHCAASDAARLAEGLRHVVGAAPVRLDPKTDIAITISIGVAVGPLRDPATAGIGDLVERADLALRHSKLGGRNLVTFNRSAA